MHSARRTTPRAPKGVLLSACGTLEEEFLVFSREIDALLNRRNTISRQVFIRVKAWRERLSYVNANPAFERLRNLYLGLLFYCLSSNDWNHPPVHKMPKDQAGPVPGLPPDVVCMLRHRIGPALLRETTTYVLPEEVRERDRLIDQRVQHLQEAVAVGRKYPAGGGSAGASILGGTGSGRGTAVEITGVRRLGAANFAANNSPATRSGSSIAGRGGSLHPAPAGARTISAAYDHGARAGLREDDGLDLDWVRSVALQDENYGSAEQTAPEKTAARAAAGGAPPSIDGRGEKGYYPAAPAWPGGTQQSGAAADGIGSARSGVVDENETTTPTAAGAGANGNQGRRGGGTEPEITAEEAAAFELQLLEEERRIRELEEENVALVAQLKAADPRSAHVSNKEQNIDEASGGADPESGVDAETETGCTGTAPRVEAGVVPVPVEQQKQQDPLFYRESIDSSYGWNHYANRNLIPDGVVSRLRQRNASISTVPAELSPGRAGGGVSSSNQQYHGYRPPQKTNQSENVMELNSQGRIRGSGVQVGTAGPGEKVVQGSRSEEVRVHHYHHHDNAKISLLERNARVLNAENKRLRTQVRQGLAREQRMRNALSVRTELNGAHFGQVEKDSRLPSAPPQHSLNYSGRAVPLAKSYNKDPRKRVEDLLHDMDIDYSFNLAQTQASVANLDIPGGSLQDMVNYRFSPSPRGADMSFHHHQAFESNPSDPLTLNVGGGGAGGGAKYNNDGRPPPLTKIVDDEAFLTELDRRLDEQGGLGLASTSSSSKRSANGADDFLHYLDEFQHQTKNLLEKRPARPLVTQFPASPQKTLPLAIKLDPSPSPLKSPSKAAGDADKLVSSQELVDLIDRSLTTTGCD